jgi:phosphopantothenoylcysteine decarboxylase/phosphopantothenate--cysteine ligase
MNDEMFAHPQTQANLARLRDRGISIVGPESGALAEGPSDRPGRMSEPATIVAHAARRLARGGPLDGKRVVVTAGPTREPIDPVRVVTNRSSGKMGFRIAEVAWQRGADVLLIAGPVGLEAPAGVELERIETTAQMEQAVAAALPTTDVLVMAAAPADFRPASPTRTKQARSAGPLQLALEPTRDILQATLGARKPGSLMVGFALETGDAESRARTKLERKQLDLVVVNDALEPGAGFEVDTNRVTLLDRFGDRVVVPLQDKRAVAGAILDEVERLLG